MNLYKNTCRKIKTSIEENRYRYYSEWFELAKIFEYKMMTFRRNICKNYELFEYNFYIIYVLCFWLRNELQFDVYIEFIG